LPISETSFFQSNCKNDGFYPPDTLSLLFTAIPYQTLSTIFITVREQSYPKTLWSLCAIPATILFASFMHGTWQGRQDVHARINVSAGEQNFKYHFHYAIVIVLMIVQVQAVDHHGSSPSNTSGIKGVIFSRTYLPEASIASNGLS